MRVAAIATIYHPKSHADVIATKFMKGMSTDEGLMPPEVDLVSLYIDHVLENDIGVGLAQEYGVPIYPSIRRALHAGADKLNVDAVLLIGEHGDYPWNERGRHMYPRRYFFEQIAGVFAESGRSVPVFSDKHFAYDFRDAQWMWDRAEGLGIPLMAGSSLPLSWRSPWLEHPKETSIEEALSIGYGASRHTGTTPWRLCSAWSSGATAASREWCGCSALKETTCGAPATRGCGLGNWPRPLAPRLTKSRMGRWRNMPKSRPFFSWSTAMACARRR